MTGDADDRVLWLDAFGCPHCGGTSYESVTDLEDVNFLCLGCGACWHVELGYAELVDPHTCSGCPHRPECLERDLARRLVERAVGHEVL